MAFGPAGAAEQGQLDASPSLFTVLAAINAAGYDTDLASPSSHPLREAIRREIARRKPPVLEDLKYFYAKHKLKDPAADLSQYISFALSVDGPPNFKFRFRTVDLPPDVAPLQELPGLLVKFHQQAGIDELWKASQPAFDQVIARYHEPVSRAVLESNVYLRSATSGFLGRRFQIYIDLLAAPHQIHTRNYADDFYLVLTPSPEPHIDDVRRAYLQCLLDPTVLKYGDLLLKNKALLDYAQGAPALPEQYKSDFVLLATKSLVLAVEARLMRGRGPELVARALSEGYVLTPHFHEQLIAYEKQDQAIRLYMPELIKAIDLKREERRLERIEYAAAHQLRTVKIAAPPPPPELAGAARTLDQAEALYAERKLEEARQAFARATQETEEKPVHAKAYYGLARIAALQKNPELAERLFQKALELEPEPAVKAWVLVYLGRLAEAAGELDPAAKFYRQALLVEGASPGARAAAEKGVRQK
ncbi:MAG: tetratricopeptide repeat protein [Acidobacteria bacterium]|nr:tetratricopeptide repeat protein [Acidobacteriota bacterium]